jgi:hypothetical protein
VIQVRESTHQLVLPPDVTGKVIEAQGVFSDSLYNPDSLYGEIARVGTAIMRAALIELRGDTTENTEVIDGLTALLEAGNQDWQDIQDSAFKMSGRLLRMGLIIDRHYDNPADAARAGFFGGMGLLGVGTAVSKFAQHPKVEHAASGGPSVSGYMYQDYDIARTFSPSLEAPAIASLGNILNTRPSNAIAISTQSYGGIMAKRLKFSATTTYPGHTVASKTSFGTRGQADGSVRINVSADSYHVQTRENITEVESRSGSMTDLTGEIYDSIHTSL